MPVGLFDRDEFGEFQILMEIIPVYLPRAVFPETHGPRLVIVQDGHGCLGNSWGPSCCLCQACVGPEPRALTHHHQLKVIGVEDTQELGGDLV